MSIWKIQAGIFISLLLGYALAACALERLPDDPTHEPVAAFATMGPSIWSVPAVTPSLRQKYASVDPNNAVPKVLLNKTLAFFDAHQSQIANKSYVGVVDFSVPSSKVRFWVVGLKDGSVVAVHVAHGTGSDPKNSGLPTLFSNTPNSHMSSLGFYLTAEVIQHNGTARKLDGLVSTNSNARARAIWLHSASYVVEKDVQPGRSWGCLAVATAKRDWIMKTLSQGSLIYAGQSAKE